MPQKLCFYYHVSGGRGRSGSYFSLPVGRFADGELLGIGVPIYVFCFVKYSSVFTCSSLTTLPSTETARHADTRLD